MRHLTMPIRLTTNGQLATTAQDSAADIAQSLGLLLATREGERISVPDYGTPDPLFEGPDLTATAAAVEFWEPRAADVTLELTGTQNSPTVNVTAAEGGTD